MTEPPRDAPPDRAALEPEWRRAFDWVERELGGRIVRFARQPRWRPAWFIDLERDGETWPLYFRGDRGAMDHGVAPLEHEMRVLQVLERHDVPVPHVHGFCEDPRGILLERCPGHTPLTLAGSEAEREAVLDHYVEILARMHAIDVAEFEAIGIARPPSGAAGALVDFDAWEKAYRSHKRRPEPAIEFMIDWVRRHAPADPAPPRCIACDSGQFLFEDGRVTAVLDLELATLGDPAADWAGLRARDLSEPLGDLSRALLHYEAQSGRKLDRDAIDHHTVRWCLCTPLVVAHLVADPPPGIDLAQYLAWCCVYARAPLELMAERAGVALVDPDPPTGCAGPASPVATALDATLAELAGDTAARPEDRYHADSALRLAGILERDRRFGAELAAVDLDDAARLLGRRPASRREADADLETLVATEGASREAELIAFFHRRLRREELRLGPALRELEGRHLQPLRRDVGDGAPAVAV